MVSFVSFGSVSDSSVTSVISEVSESVFFVSFALFPSFLDEQAEAIMETARQAPKTVVNLLLFISFSSN
jgi:hypothetical protein